MPRVDITDLTVHYRNSNNTVHALDSIEFWLKENESMGIAGESGCGKTTLLRGLAGLEKSDHGFLKVGDSIWQDGKNFKPPHLRSVGYVFQEASLFGHLNVRGNLEYGASRAIEAEKDFMENTLEILYKDLWG